MFLRRKKDEELEVLEEKKTRRKKLEEEELVWDKKKVVIVIFLIAFGIFVAMQIKNTFFPGTSILGESTVKKASEVEKPEIESPNLNLQSKVVDSIDQVKEDVANIDPEEVASSSPQIQKVLKDIQGIKNLPSDKVKEACYKACSSL